MRIDRMILLAFSPVTTSYLQRTLGHSIKGHSTLCRGLPQSQIDTVNWIESFVIKHNLCPFAKEAISKQVTYRVFDGGDTDPFSSPSGALKSLTKVLKEELSELEAFDGDGATSFIIAPSMFSGDFQKYMDFVNDDVSDLLTNLDLHGTIQVAPFHPHFMFGGTNQNDPGNKVNQSPHPMFHLLREVEVSAASDQQDTQKIWERNERLLTKLFIC